MHSGTKNSPWRDVTVFKNTKKKVCYIKTIDEYVTVFDDFFLIHIVISRQIIDESISIADFFPPNRGVDFYCRISSRQIDEWISYHCPIDNVMIMRQ